MGSRRVDAEELLSVPEDQFMDFCIAVEGTTQRIKTNKTTIFIGQVEFSFGSPVSFTQEPFMDDPPIPTSCCVLNSIDSLLDGPLLWPLASH